MEDIEKTATSRILDNQNRINDIEKMMNKIGEL
jgi:hypothetical protein